MLPQRTRMRRSTATSPLALKCGAGRGHLKPDDSTFRNRVLQKPGRTNIVDEGVNGREYLRLSFRDDDRLRHAEQVVRQETIAGHFVQQAGKSLTVGPEGIDLASQEPTFRIGRRVVGLDQSRLSQVACEIEFDQDTATT